MLKVDFNPFPEIRTERLLLRRLKKEDVGQIFEMRSNEHVMKFIGKNLVTSIDEAMDFYNLVNNCLDNNEGVTWAITLIEFPERMIGTIGFWHLILENYRAEIGYMFLPDYWKKGLGKEALLKIIGYGFNEMKLHSIEARINPQNIASALLLKNTGFVKEAYFKEDFYFNGAFDDTEVYSLLA